MTRSGNCWFLSQQVRSKCTDLLPPPPPKRPCRAAESLSGSRKRGVEFKGGSLHDGFGGFDGAGEHLALLLLDLENTAQWGNRGGFDGFGGFGGFGGHGGLGRDGYPP